MQLNITKPLQILQWSAYIYILILVKGFIIFPIAILLFNDFYLRLLPSDSSQWVPLSKFNVEEFDEGIEFFQKIERIPIEWDIPALPDNGIPESIPLRDHISYKMDFDMNFFCISPTKNLGYTPSGISELVLEIHSTERKQSLIFKRNIPILCMTNGDNIVEDELYDQGPSRLSLYEKEWINHIKIHDKVDIGPEDNEIKYIWTIRSESPRILFNLESGFRLRMNFEQGLRNLMLRWHKITYIIGVVVFDCAISTIFGIAVLISFYSLSNKLKSRSKKD